MRIPSTAALTLLVLSSPALGAEARSAQCGYDRDLLVASLTHEYAEEPEAIGLSSWGLRVEILTSPTGTWTIISTSPDGDTCIVGSGKAYESLAKLGRSS